MIISIGGNIGSGKSTIIKKIKSHYTTIRCIPEPIDEWGEWLGKFYEDPKKYALGFQLKILNAFNYIDNPSDIYVTERSPWESKHVFADLLHKQGLLTPIELALYNDFYKEKAWEPQYYIYLYTNYTECIQRIHKRNRNEETSINEDYVSELHDQYNKVFSMSNASNQHIVSDYAIGYTLLNGIHVYLIDSNRPVDEVFGNVSLVLNRIVL